ncbi:MAG: thioredoxin domain-containing protein [Nitrospirota bacterium]|nr:thioredoxin domain-containing protein [Nitrospirota bacterium]
MAFTNRLIHETSPYLLQHAHNPVDWYPWGEEAFEAARKDDKLVLISIGYSSCHWCHVMEHEVFENNEAAILMNKHFICIKVDREERPDIDQVYMTAVQLMTQRGGWPLNCFALPDGRPIYGGTYFPLEQWKNLLQNLLEVKQREAEKFEEYATALARGVAMSDLVEVPTGEVKFEPAFIDQLVSKWSGHWDTVHGGTGRSPKFPMPAQLDFLLSHIHLKKILHSTHDASWISTMQMHLDTTLKKMALGGIYDQVGGGFSRYSVDEYWKVPHFEKMLYDNAQLITVYARAYRASRVPLYREVIEQSCEFIERELTSPEGLCYSALDADSEGEEGKFYTWTKEEFVSVCGEDAELGLDYFSVNENGLWENDNYILLRGMDDWEYAEAHVIGLSTLQDSVGRIREKLLAARSQRIRPGLDNKCLASWNALMIEALVESFYATGRAEYLGRAERIANAVLRYMFHEGNLLHCRTNGKSTIMAFHDDYAFIANAFLSMYESTGQEQWLKTSEQLTDQAIAIFEESNHPLYWYSDERISRLFARKKEVDDNVIPSSNSVFALLLAKLASHLGREDFAEKSKSMLGSILPRLNYAGAYSCWLQVYQWWAYAHHEVVFTGPRALSTLTGFKETYVPNCVVAASTVNSSLPLFQHRDVNIAAIYVCSGSTCHAPVNELEQALEYLV